MLKVDLKYLAFNLKWIVKGFFSEKNHILKMMYRNWGYRRNHIKETESKIIFF